MLLLRPFPLSPSPSRRLLFPKSTNPTNLRRHRVSLPPLASTHAPSSHLASSVGSPVGLPQWSPGGGHIRLLSAAACAAAISTTWLFFSAIPALLAFKKTAESMEKLMDDTTAELPDTMAAVRLSGMEISELTMELSGISQEITQGVRSSTRVVRSVEDRLSHLTTMPPTVPVQAQAPPRDLTEGPAAAKTARNLREGIIKGRSVLGAIFSITQFSRWMLNFLAARKQKRSL